MSISIYMCVCARVCVCVHVCVHACVCACVCERERKNKNIKNYTYEENSPKGTRSSHLYVRGRKQFFQSIRYRWGWPHLCCPLEHPRWLRSKESACQNAGDARDMGLTPWIRKIPWSRKYQPAAVFLPGKFHGQKSLAVFSTWDCKEPDMTKHNNNKHR